MTHHIVTITILILYVLNSGWYGIQGDYGRMLYWMFATGITVSATWLIR